MPPRTATAPGAANRASASVLAETVGPPRFRSQRLVTMAPIAGRERSRPVVRQAGERTFLVAVFHATQHGYARESRISCRYAWQAWMPGRGARSVDVEL